MGVGRAAVEWRHGGVVDVDLEAGNTGRSRQETNEEFDKAGMSNSS